MRSAVVLIAAYQRPEGLRRLLGSLHAGIEGVDAAVDVIVADNDPAGSAATVVAQTPRIGKSAVHYIHEPTPGIPAARNALLEAAADANFLAFIDDDEVAEPGWLAALLETAARYDADIVAGPVIYEFGIPPRAVVACAPCFAVPRQETGTTALYPRTGNALVRRRAIERAAVRFRDEYALTGGSDRAFFEDLVIGGARPVWCDEAVVREHVPPERQTFGYVVRRGLRIGNTTTLVERDVAPSRRRVVIRAAKAIGWLGRGSATAIVGVATRRPAATSTGAWHAARGVGMLLGLASRRVVGYPRG